MHKIDGPGHFNNTFASENPTTGRAPTLVTPEWLNAVQGELAGVVVDAGLPLDKADDQQVIRALAVLARLQKYTAFATAGDAPSFTLNCSPAVTAYTPGLRFRVRFHALGSGAATLNVNGLGAKSIKQYDSAGGKVTAVIAANQLADLEYDGVEFVLGGPLPMEQSVVLPGAVFFFARSAAPDGYLKANGASVSRTTYAALFQAIGTAFGAGNGSTTFTLPDLRGEFIRGWSDGGPVDLGRAFGSGQADEFKSHTHAYSIPFYGAIDIPIGSPNVTRVGIAQNTATGAAGGSETRPRNVALLACIKY